MLERLGSKWGGWTIDVSLIDHGDLILSGGLADDTSFEQSLFDLKNCRFIGIDPTDTSEKHYNKLYYKHNYKFIKAALSSSNSDYKTYDGVKCVSVKLQDLLNCNDFSLVKLDIEGGEYECIESISDWKNIKQIGVEFHHWVPEYGKTIEMTHAAINKLKRDSFKLVFHKANVPSRKIQECLFIKQQLTDLPEVIL